ncbi:SPFH domain-containing protein [Anaerocolumna sp. AGMB13020]|uniref:SPFH domain-containing protein n=1 Tax=Anaerocolumna sp. AGMB13020 TaxID=3081750 RepID=UPI0029537FA4|nr:SPFH domain-containing protein [Anaerocolumna sp. AGMB13020]WOO36737.1 SPFH domain-containing protein [Anaerocolumna sp. AGMB13020]
MNISQVLQFGGKIDDLVWKHPIEDFNTSSQLVVEETHEALLVMNGNACDLFGPGKHTLTTPNIPLVQKLINIPTGDESSFPCKVFFINKIHQMDMTWGIPGEITLNDPVYDIFLHVGLCGNLNFVIKDSRKFMLKIVGFRSVFEPQELVAKFRGIIKQYVKSIISKIMNVGKISFFDMNENLFEISDVVREQLVPIFEDYGVEMLLFNIETITVPDEDYEAVKKAKELRSSRIIQGYTWQEERQMNIAEKFAGNEGTMGGIGGALGGFLAGGAFGGNIAELARTALNPDVISKERPPIDLRNIESPLQDKVGRAFDVKEFAEGLHKQNEDSGVSAPSQGANKDIGEQVTKVDTTAKFCTGCGNQVSADMLFCPKCGTKQSKVCANCQTPLMPEAIFCHQCGTKC